MTYLYKILKLKNIIGEYLRYNINKLRYIFFVLIVIKYNMYEYIVEMIIMEIKKKNKKYNNIIETTQDKFKNIFNIKNKKNTYTRRQVFIITIFSAIIGFFLCFGIISLVVRKNYFTVMRDLDKVIDTYYTIVDNYFGDLNKDNLVDGAINGIISSVGDEFTSYTDVDSVDEFNEMINGSYEGIGCTVATYPDDKIVVIDIFENSPSDKAGLKVGDIIIKIDNNSLENKNSIELSNYIKNNDNDKIVLTVIRDNNQVDITINLDKIEIPYVTGQIIEDNDKKIGYIKITLFASNSYKQFKTKLEKLEKEKIDGLIIDVRDNSGGYLTSVVDISNLFLEKGKIIYQLQEINSTRKKKDNTKEKRNYDIAVLINGSSASASEILASAIKESYGGYVVGTKSYGKGSVQEMKKLLDGSMIKYTSQKWLTPLGNSIDQIGLEPTNYVELNSEYFESPSMDKDNQINEALNLLKK